jgi:hypothetical protein
MLPADFTSRQGLDAAIELARFRDDIRNVANQSGRYLKTLPECPLKAEYAQLHAEVLALHERAQVFVDAGKAALLPLITMPAPKP